MRCEDIGALLDKLLDDELSDDQLLELQAHGRSCPDCAAEIQAAMQMKALFGEISPEADVPLPAQAAWRGAVRAEARRRRMKRAYAWAGAAAAALVAVVGISAALRGANAPQLKGETAPIAQVEPSTDSEEPALYSDVAEMNAYEAAGATLVETDGSEEPMAANDVAAVMAPSAFEEGELTAKDSAAPMHELRMSVESADAACDAIADLVREYEGTLDVQRVEDGANLYIDLPSENVEEFIQALRHLKQSDELLETPDTTSESTTSLLLILTEE